MYCEGACHPFKNGCVGRFGTEELFKEESGKEDEAIHYDNQAIEELLDRSKEGIEQKENWANEYLSSFKVASYVTKEGEEVSATFFFSLFFLLYIYIYMKSSICGKIPHDCVTTYCSLYFEVQF